MVVGSFTAPFISLRPASSLTWLTMCWNCGKCTNINTQVLCFFSFINAKQMRRQIEKNIDNYNQSVHRLYFPLNGYGYQCLLYNRKEPNCTLPSLGHFRSTGPGESRCVVPCKLCWLYFDQAPLLFRSNIPAQLLCIHWATSLKRIDLAFLKVALVNYWA